MRRGQPTEDGDACRAVSRDPDNLNGAASGETPGPRFFCFAGGGEAPLCRRIRNMASPSSEERGRGDQATKKRNRAGEMPPCPLRAYTRMLAPDRNFRVLSPIEMSVYRRKQFAGILCVCRKVSHRVEMDCFPGTRRDAEAWLKLPVCRSPEVALNSVCDHPAAAGIYPQSALALGTLA